MQSFELSINEDTASMLLLKDAVRARKYVAEELRKASITATVTLERKDLRLLITTSDAAPEPAMQKVLETCKNALASWGCDDRSLQGTVLTPCVDFNPDLDLTIHSETSN